MFQKATQFYLIRLPKKGLISGKRSHWLRGTPSILAKLSYFTNLDFLEIYWNKGGVKNSCEVASKFDQFYEELGNLEVGEKSWNLLRSSDNTHGSTADMNFRRCLEDTQGKTSEHPLKINGWKMYFLLKWPLFSGHVSFGGCIIYWIKKNISNFLFGRATLKWVHRL